ncbi:hypothetical protein D3C71_1496850 [compost metagenome]
MHHEKVRGGRDRLRLYGLSPLGRDITTGAGPVDRRGGLEPGQGLLSGRPIRSRVLEHGLPGLDRA